MQPGAGLIGDVTRVRPSLTRALQSRDLTLGRLHLLTRLGDLVSLRQPLAHRLGKSDRKRGEDDGQHSCSAGEGDPTEATAHHTTQGLTGWSGKRPATRPTGGWLQARGVNRGKEAAPG